MLNVSQHKNSTQVFVMLNKVYVKKFMQQQIWDLKIAIINGLIYFMKLKEV